MSKIKKIRAREILDSRGNPMGRACKIGEVSQIQSVTED
jgi:enolase